MNNPKEVEVKLRVADLAALRRRLARLGARPALRGRVHEMNTLYDTPQGGLAKHGQLLRLRVEKPSRKAAGAGNSRAVLTYKGPAEPAASPAAPGRRYKVRDELEVGVADPQQLGAILEALGLRGWFRYEKFRTRYQLPRLADLVVELDETPIGVYMELEGPPAAIDRAAKLLGYGPADYITKSYLALYLDQRRRQGVVPQPGQGDWATGIPDMLFPQKK